MQLSTLTRQQDIRDAALQHWDLIVIGGGITGAGIALDAAARGMKVLLIEKYDFAGGTSSKSTKLIHGGLRYLKQLEFGLVRTVGLERAVIHHLAPHLVQPIDMVLPIVAGGTLGKASTALALTVYDLLAGVKKEERYKMLTGLQLQTMEPLLRKEGLLGGAIYKEYRTDDARLTMAVLKSAAEQGAYCFNYLKAEQFIRSDKTITGVQARDLLHDTEYTFMASCIVNAAGPWVDDVRTLDGIPQGKKLHLTKGIHIVIPREKMPVRHAMYFDVVDDNRMIFTIPRGEYVYIGTTDTNYSGAKEHIPITSEDIDYLISAVAALFPSVRLLRSDVVSSWAGLRPLIHEEGRSPTELSRRDEIFIAESGLISIAGGKLTGYRRMAEKTVNIIARKLRRITGIRYPASNTRHLKLHGADFTVDIETYIEKRSGEAKQAGLSREQTAYLVYTYGTAAEQIIDMVFGCLQQWKDPVAAFLAAEIQYAIEHEMVTSVSDLLIRRTARVYFDMPFVLQHHIQIAEMISARLQLDPHAAEHELEWFRAALEELRHA